MHVQVKSWVKLSREERDKRLARLGVDFNELKRIRLLSPKKKILEAAKIALKIDPSPNSDFIECVAGYSGRGNLFNHFKNLDELMNHFPKITFKENFEQLRLTSGKEFDLIKIIPQSINNINVWVEDSGDKETISIWQKTTGKMRSVLLNRKINKNLFLIGIALYAGATCEGIGRFIFEDLISKKEGVDVASSIEGRVRASKRSALLALDARLNRQPYPYEAIQKELAMYAPKMSDDTRIGLQRVYEAIKL